MSEKKKFYDEITPKPYKISANTKPADKEKTPLPTSEHVAKPEKKSFIKFGFLQYKGKKKYLLSAIFLFSLFAAASLLLSRVDFIKSPEEALLTNLPAFSIPIGNHYYMFSGSHQASVSAPGYYAKTFSFDVTSGGDNQFTFELEKKPGHLIVSVIPQTDASVWLDGTMKGKAPLTIEDIPIGNHVIEIQADGYQTTNSNVVIEGLDKTQTFTATLIKKDVPARLSISSLPGEAAVNINNKFIGLTPKVHSLEAGQEYQLLVVKPGYEPVRKLIKLKSQEQKIMELVLKPKKPNKPKPQIWKKSRQLIENKLGLEFVLFKPEDKEVTYSKGRLSYTALLSRDFAISKMEITNKQFRAFVSSHSSGNFQGNNLNGENKPVVNVSWSEAALFSNWMSEQAGISPFYKTENGRVTGFKPESKGYRLVSEAEWMSVLQGEYQYRYLWGNDFDRVADKSGNYADKSAAEILTTTLEYYNDNSPVSSDVGQFYPNKYGIYDIEGNVAEWLHDIFTSGPYEERINPLGPTTGSNHVIRGGSWKYGSRRMLSTSYRQYHADKGKPEVGFRIAYYLK